MLRNTQSVASPNANSPRRQWGHKHPSRDLEKPHFASGGRRYLLALVFVSTLEAQDVGDDIQHVVFLDYDVGHGRMRGLHPYPERGSGDPWCISDFPETRRLGIWRLLSGNGVAHRT